MHRGQFETLGPTPPNAVESYFAVFWSAPDDDPFVTVITGGDRSCLTWGRFRQMCFSVAQRMRASGVGPGDTVLIFLPHQRWLIPTFVGAQLLGAIPSFMPPANVRQDRALFRTNHELLIATIEPALICVDATTASALPTSHRPVLTLDEIDRLEGGTDRGLHAAIGPALLQHSSGTTGLKKGIILSYEAIIAQIHSYARALELAGNETIVTWLPLYHDMGLIAATLLPLVSGIPLVAMSAFDWLAQPWRLLEEMASRPDTMTWVPNFALAVMARTARRMRSDLKLDGVRAIINCSEPCQPGVTDRFVAAYRDRGLRAEHVQTCYAMAENTFAVTQSRLGSVGSRWTPPSGALHAERFFPRRTLLSCGPCVDGVRLQVRDGAGRCVADGEIGDLYVSGTSLFDGYRGQAELTATKLRDGWYATGDLGALRGGELYVAGRRDDLIIIAGRSLYAHEIEEEVSMVEGVRPGRVCAFGIADEESGTEELVVMAEHAPGMLSETELKRNIRIRLAGTVLVSSATIIVLSPDTLVKTTSGKVSRGENKARFAQRGLISWREPA